MPKRYAKPKVVKRDVTAAEVEEILASIKPQFTGPTQRKMDAKRANNKYRAERQRATRNKRFDAKLNKLRKQREKDKPLTVRPGKENEATPTSAGGRKGTDFSKLRPETQKALIAVDKKKAEIEKLSGKKVPEKEGTFSKIIHNISRLNYGSGNAVEEAAKEFQQSRYEKQGIGESLKDALGRIPEGWAAGTSLKSKVSFPGVIQGNADRAAAVKAGRAPNQAIKNEGKANPFLKYGAGFVADVLLDPTTYMGLGLVSKAAQGGKALKSDDVVKIVEDNVKAQKTLRATGVNAPAGAVNARLSTSTIPVEVLKRGDIKKLNANPETKRILDDAFALRKDIGAKGVQRLRNAGKAQHLNKATNSGSSVLKDIESMSNDAFNALIMQPNWKQKAEALGINKADDITSLMRETLAKNLSPEVSKSFALRVGGAKIAEPAALATKLAQASQRVGSVKHVEKSVKFFNDTLNANYKIAGVVRPFRNQRMGMGANAIRAEAENFKSIWDNVSKSERRRIGQALRHNAAAGSTVKGGRSLVTGEPVDNLAQHTLDEIRAIQTGVKNLGLKPNQLNAMLTDKFSLSDDAFDFVTDTKKIKHADGSVTTNKTKVFHDNFLEDLFMKNPEKFDDPAEFIYRYRVALANAATQQAMNKTLRQVHGIPLRKAAVNTTGYDTVANRMAQQLVKKEGWRAPRLPGSNEAIPGFEDTIFHPEIADSIARMHQVFFSESARKEYMKNLDKITQGFKASVTKYVPAFHIRTLMSEVMLGQIGGMKNIVGSYNKALRVLHNSNEHFMGPGGAIKADGYTKAQVNATNQLRAGYGAPVGANTMQSFLPRMAANSPSKVILRHPKFGSLSADQIRAFYNTSGLKAGFASTDMMRGADATLLGKGARKASDATGHLMESVEDLGRMAHFIDIIQYSKAKTLEDAVQEATETVLKMHLDYTAVTGREKNVMARVVPFYKWMRLSIPLMAHHMLVNPGKVMVVPKGMQALSGLTGYDATERTITPGNPDEVIPEWIREAGAMPIGGLPGAIFGNNTNYFDPTSTFPLSSISEGTDVSNFINMLHPGLKIPGDLAHGKNKFGPAPGNSAAGIPGVPYAATLTPQTNTVRKLLSKPDPNNPEDERTGDPDISRMQILFDLLANPGLRPNTQNRMASQALAEREEMTKELKALKKKLGIKSE